MSHEDHPATSQTFSPITTAGIFMSASSASWGKWSSYGVQILSTAIISITSPVSRRKHYRNSSADGDSSSTIRSTRLETTWCNLFTLASPLDYSSQTLFGSGTGMERVPRIGLIYWHL